jgi:pyruvate kinase
MPYSLLKEVKKTKIIATIGPRSESKRVIRQLIECGLNVVRLNASHQSDPQTMKKIVGRIRQVSKECRKPVGILLDLQGPKIRVGRIRSGKIMLRNGQDIVLTPEKVMGTSRRLSISYADIVNDVNVGDPVFIDDGNIRLVVTEVRRKDVVCKVEQGGILSNYKGINVPRSEVHMSAITEKDRRDLKIAVENKLDFVALSFVKDAADIHELRGLLKELGNSQIAIIAKIERPSAVTHIESIIKASDGVMVARGDLGVEIGTEHVPEVQKMIIREANRLIKPVVVATQMLESMITKKVPTRAEVSDVANAIYDRCDAVMLSGESAVGIDPANSVLAMRTICEATDGHLVRLRQVDGIVPVIDPELRDETATYAIAADHIATQSKAAALMVFTERGFAPLISSKLNPGFPIIAVTDRPAAVTRVALYRGVIPLYMKNFEGAKRWSDMINLAILRAKEYQLVKSGDTVVVAARVQSSKLGGLNSIRSVVVP